MRFVDTLFNVGSVVRFLNSPANQGRVSSEIIFIKAMRFQKEIPAKPGRVSSENFKFSPRLYHFPLYPGSAVRVGTNLTVRTVRHFKALKCGYMEQKKLRAKPPKKSSTPL